MPGIQSQVPQSSKRPPCASKRSWRTEGTIDFQTTTHQPTDLERQAVDRVLGDPDSVYSGAAERTAADDHVAYGGFHESQERRHLLLPTLHGVQDEIGWVSHGAINYISKRLPVSPADAHGVASFYDLIATEQRPPRVANVCDDVACKAAGVGRNTAHLVEVLGEPGELGKSAQWVRSPCLGQCEKGSAAYIQVAGGEDLVIAPATADQVIEVLEAEAPQSLVSPTPSASGTRLLAGTPNSLDEHLRNDGYNALRHAFAVGAPAVVDEVAASGLRGRGGAAFPAGVKWKAVAAADGPRYVVCNADESEPGTFKDRVLMEADPYLLIEAITIAGFGIGATRGFIYIRGEYPLAHERLTIALREIRSAGLLGVDIAGSEFSFDIEVRRGGGAYICGEETALFNSIEGFRGEPRQKPPFPTEAGLFGRPTLVNNVESLMNVPSIVMDGGDSFAAIGTPESTGPKLFCVSGNVNDPGVYEVEFGATTRELIQAAGGVDGDLAAVLVGGAAGTFLRRDQLDVPMTFEDSTAADIALGSGVVIVFNTKVDLAQIVVRIAHFFREESCGLCVPCRVGTVRQEESLKRLATASIEDAQEELVILGEIDEVLRDASICGLGQFASAAIQTALDIGLIGSDT